MMLASSTANAQVTIYHIKVVQTNAGGTATYCDGSSANPCGVTPSTGVWPGSTGVTFPVTLNGGDTLVLAQTGTVDCSQFNPPQTGCVFGNFDTSDLVQTNFAGACSTAKGTPCRTQIYLDTTNTGLVLVYDTNVSGVANELAHFNIDSGDDVACEGAAYNQVVTAATYTLATGYADNLHLNNCNFFPTPFSGATHVAAAGAPRPPIGNDVGGTNFCSTANSDCFDSGVILITGIAARPCFIPSSQTIISNTSWNKFNTQGSNNVVWIHAHIGKPAGISTSTTTDVDFTNVKFVLNNVTYDLPNGHLVFDPNAPATATTSWNGTEWTTTLNPNNLSDEIFFTGDAIPVDANITGGGKAALSFDTSSTSTSLAFSWQWSAAAYSTWLGNTQANIEPVHATLHAGAPQNKTQEGYLIQGPRGGGGSNYTGSWSATGNGTCK
jgi:hypothetical protein